MPELTRLVLEPSATGDKWRVVERWRYRLPDGREVAVESGFETDLASTPRTVWVLFPPFGRWTRAAVLHDWLYRHPEIEGVAVTRHEADDVLRAVMDEWGCEPLTSKLFHDAVRIGAGDTWDRYRKEDQP